MQGGEIDTFGGEPRRVFQKRLEGLVFARRDDEKVVEMGNNLGQHIVFHRPGSLSRDRLDPAIVEKEKEIYRAQVESGAKKKPPEIVEKIVTGKLDKFFAEKCLLDQPFYKDDKVKVAELLQGAVAKLGENIVVRKFSRMEVGR